MALLIIGLDKHIGNAKAWRDTFKEQLPDMEIRIWPDAADLRDIEYLAFMHPDCGFIVTCPPIRRLKPIKNGARHLSSGLNTDASVFWVSESWPKHLR